MEMRQHNYSSRLDERLAAELPLPGADVVFGLDFDEAMHEEEDDFPFTVVDDNQSLFTAELVA